MLSQYHGWTQAQLLAEMRRIENDPASQETDPARSPLKYTRKAEKALSELAMAITLDMTRRKYAGDGSDAPFHNIGYSGRQSNRRR